MQKRIIALFDVDGTLTPARNYVKQPMLDCLEKMISSQVEVGIVSGSDKVKLLEQFPIDMVNKLPWVFTENGLVAYKNGEHYASRSFSEEIGEENLQKFINFCLKYMS